MLDSSRMIYDECAYKHALKQSLAPVSYMLNPDKETANPAFSDQEAEYARGGIFENL